MGSMKTYRHLVESLPSDTVVFAFGRFNPPTVGHQLLVNMVKRVAKSHKADHAIYVSRSEDKKKNPLNLQEKLKYLHLMFPNTTFVGASNDVRTFIEAAKHLNKTYKRLIMIAGSDRVPAYVDTLNKYNGKEYDFQSISVISAGERDPDADDASGMSASKMRSLAAKNQYNNTVEAGKVIPGFKSGLPSSLRDVDGRQLMQDVRRGMGLSPVKEQLWLGPNALREQYIKGEIFNVSDLVECNGVTFEIIERGTNYLRVVDNQGDVHRKWLHECHPTTTVNEDVSPGYPSEEISFKGYTTQNFHHAPEAAQAFHDTINRYGQTDPMTVLVALKATDQYLKINDIHLEDQQPPTPEEVQQWKAAHDKARESLTRIQEFLHHFQYWHDHEHELQDTLVKYNLETAGAEMADSYTPQGEQLQELSKTTLKSYLTATNKSMSSRKKDSRGRTQMQRIPVRQKGHTRAVDRLLGQQRTPQGFKSYTAEELTDQTIKSSDKIKVARVIADMLGVEQAEKMSPEAAINAGLQKIKNKKMTPELTSILKKMISLAKELHINVNMALLPKSISEDYHNMSQYSGIKKLVNPVNDEEEEDEEGEIDDQADDMQSVDHTRIGHALHPDKKDDQKAVRYMKIKYHTEQVSRDEDEEEQSDKKSDEIPTSDYKISKTGRKYPAHRVVVEEADDVEYDESDLDDIVKSVNHEDDILDVYDDNEFTIVDLDTNKIAEQVEPQPLVEVLSRIERMRAHIRFMRSASKRARRLQIALHRHSDSKTINKRARRLAVLKIKQRFAKKPVDQLTVAEKERIERVIESNPSMVNRLALKLVPKIRAIEQQRLTHPAVTKPAG